MLEQEEVEQLKATVKETFSGSYELGGGKEFRYHHLLRTHRYIKKLMDRDELRNLEFDEEVVQAAAILHDIGRKDDIEDGYLDPMNEREHAERGAERVSGHLEGILDEDQIRLVEKVIRNHHSEPETVEGEILQDCDALSNFGVNNLWRMIHYSAEKERTLEQSLEYFWDEALEAYRKKLNDFNLEVTKRIAKKRIVDHQEAVLKMEQEAMAEDI